MKEYQDHSLRGRVFNALREDILSGKYKENEELREITIGEEMGVSRTPVREALRQLALEGLVKIIPNKGAYVTGINGKDIADIYAIRSRLEGLCARWATDHITQEQLEKMEEVLLLSEFYGRKKEDGGHIVELDSEFHKVLYEASNSRILQHMLTDFHNYVRKARKTSVEKKDRAEKSIAEHRGIYEAIKAKNANLAEQLAYEHIRHVVDNLM